MFRRGYWLTLIQNIKKIKIFFEAEKFPFFLKQLNKKLLFKYFTLKTPKLT